MAQTCNKAYLQFNPVELIKAGPSTGLSQSFEELPHGFVIQSIGAVEHHTLYINRDTD